MSADVYGLPTSRRSSHPVAAVATVGNSLNTMLAVAPFKGKVTAVKYVPQAVITGQNTNTRKLELYNRGQDGTGTTLVATLQFDSGVNAAAKTPKSITLSATAANLLVADGDVLEWQSTAVGTGIADPSGIAVVEFGRGAGI